MTIVWPGLGRIVAPALLGVLILVFNSAAAVATSFSWNLNTGGAFDDNTKWTQNGIIDLDGVPDSNDTVTFRRGSGVTYSVNFPGVLLTPVDYITDRLLVGSNSVTLADVKFGAASTYAVANTTTSETGRAIIVGVSASDTAAVLTNRLPAFSGAAATIGDAAGSSGTLDVSAGTFSVTASDAANVELIVGRYGDGAINVTGGAGVKVTQDAMLGEYAGSSGMANVSGAGSTWTNGFSSLFGSGFLTVGSAGAGTLAITDGGFVSSNAGSSMGSATGSNGLATVDGAGSTWTVVRNLHLGVSGSATLNVAHAGQVNVERDFGVSAGDIYVGDVSGSTGEINVTTGGQISSGQFDNNMLSTVHVGTLAGSLGTVTVNGAGSKWNYSGGLLVGELGNGTLTINNGGQVDSTNLLMIGAYGSIANGSGSTGVANVAGAGSKWIDTGNLYVGNAGIGTLNVSAGGQVSNSTGYIGNQSDSTGMASVDGADSMWTNNGNLFVGNTGTGTLYVTNFGTVAVGGQLVVGALGEVHGDGYIDGNLSNGGLVSPGNSPGALHVAGNYAQSNTGKLQIELAGTTPGSQYDQLLISGSATLDGTLQAALLGGFAPHEGDSFNVLDFASRTGLFSSVDLPTLTGSLKWDTSQLYANGVLSVVLPGDYNGNGVLDAADYVVWRGAEGTTNTLPNDLIGGTIGQPQYDQWRAHFGQTAGSSGSASANAAVPEPATLVVLMFTAAGWCLRRRRRAC
jgi:T5SS/PEP-CTERM-associated repeat protein